MILSQAAR